MGAELKREKTGLAIRRMLDADARNVIRILQDAPHAANWSGESLTEALNWSGGLALVSEAEGEISGFLLGRQVGDEAEILNVAVTLGKRRLGAGSGLLKAALDFFRESTVSRVFLEVRESNEGAIAFYEMHGFARTGRRPGYYHDPADAAVLMAKKLTG